jgi:hypothetical protein
MSRVTGIFVNGPLWLTAACTAVLLACGSREVSRAPSAADSASSAGDSVPTASPTKPPDSLVATAPGGVQIWFTLAREAQGDDGSHCIDRTLEIRRNGKRVPVPLLYTATAPEVVNDSTIRARLSFRCKPGDAYLVDLRSGHPSRER